MPFGWMPGSSPLLSGLDRGPLEGELIWIVGRRFWWVEQVVQVASVHQVGADEAGEGERTFDELLGGLGHPQQQEGDQGDGDLNADGVFAGAEEMADFQGLLDPAENNSMAQRRL